MAHLVEKGKIINRLKRLEGQVRGIQKMVEESRECEEIMIQVSALNSAQARVTRLIIACYMGETIQEEMEKHGDSFKAIQKALDFFINTKP